MAALQVAPQEIDDTGEAQARNSAFLFIKPHALLDSVIWAVKGNLAARGITIQSEGRIDAAAIDEERLIDKHYYSIASKATILKPYDLNVPQAKFENYFELSWEDALARGLVYNALDAAKELELSGPELDLEWAKAKQNKKIVKLAGGFYCGLLEVNDRKMYVMNGFFMAMRDEYVRQGSAIHYMTVEWDPAQLSFESFRNDVLGPNDPVLAPRTSLRGMMYGSWKELGFKEPPSTGTNCVHASASPLEALCEKLNWLSVPMVDDPFGAACLNAGIPEQVIVDKWTLDPQVALLNGGKGSIWDAVENQDVDVCLASLDVSIPRNSKGWSDFVIESEMGELRFNVSAQTDLL
jgi:hypothetical protein